MSTTSAGTNSSELFTRLQTFLAENKRAVLIGTAATVVAIGGVAYYASSSRINHDDDIDSEKGEKKKDKRKSRGKKKKGVKDKDGPLLEERKPKAGESKTSSESLVSSENRD
jgi:mitochondrial import receptor subunit TOM70